MYPNVAKMIIGSGVRLVMACAILVLASTITLAITTGSASSVHNADRVRQVDKDIAVRTEAALSSRIAERSYGERMRDTTVTAKVKSKLWLSAYSDGLSTIVTTRDGTVTLTGSASSSDARNLAGWIAISTRGVVVLDNQLTVQKLDVVGAPTTVYVDDSTVDSYTSSPALVLHTPPLH